MSHLAPEASAQRAQQWRDRNKVRTHGGRSLFAFAFSFLTFLAMAQTAYSVASYTISQGWSSTPVIAASLAILTAPLGVLWFCLAGRSTIQQGRKQYRYLSGTGVRRSGIGYILASYFLCCRIADHQRKRMVPHRQ